MMHTVDNGRDWGDTSEALAALGIEALEQLLDQLDAQESETRMRAARLIGDLGMYHDVRSTRVILPLVYSLKADDSAEVRALAAYALAQYDEPSAKDALSAALMTDGSPMVRARAAQELGRFGGDRAIGALIRAYDDPHPLVRRAIITALARAAEPRAHAALKAALDDPDIDTAQLAAMGILRQRHDQAVYDLAVNRWVLTSPDIQAAVLPFLLRSATAPLALFLLGQTAGDAAVQIKARLLGHLGHVGDAQILPSLLLYLNDGHELVRGAAIRALRALIVRERITEAIISPLVAVARSDPQEAARRAAVRALGETRDARAYQALIRLLPQTQGALRREIVAILGDAARYFAAPHPDNPPTM